MLIAAAVAAAAVVCTSPHIADGDTITCSGVRVRLFRINAPDLSHPDLHIDEEPGGRAASARLPALTRTRVNCTIAGNQYDRYSRMVAKCGTDRTPDLGAEMVREGLACQWIRYSRHEYYGLGRDCDRRGK
jgi:endonuclease YncB( thermonuclease family)